MADKRYTWLDVLGITDSEASRILAVARLEPDGDATARAIVSKVSSVGVLDRVHIATVERWDARDNRMDDVRVLVRPAGRVK